ncbi:MAG: catechol 2,3-dioxygenase-like lactoylglutathione lyase family enzyme [Gammaproteobacteria bacterium]|jgi:catechol 2,3-dioxygenase-like lactoylglutathione lyase family enzyme
MNDTHEAVNEPAKQLLGRFFHVNICVRDMERSIRFYERLGFNKVNDFMLGGGEPSIGAALGVEVKQLRGVFMRLGSESNAPMIDLVQFVDPPPEGEPYPSLNNVGICRIAFLVDDIDAVYRELQAQDVEFVRPLQKLEGPKGSKIGVVCFKDPDGTVLELISSNIEAMT